MEQPRRRRPLILLPGQVILGEAYRIQVTNTERLVCDGERYCYALVLDLLQTRTFVPCPDHFFGGAVEGDIYCSTLRRFLSDSFSTLGLGFVQDSVDRLAKDLSVFVADFVIYEHSCPLDGPRLIPVIHVSVVPIADISVMREVVARSFNEAPVWAKRATHQSIEALETVRARDLEGDGGSCVICFEGFDVDGGGKEIARMPCGHVFHRGCIAGWLKNSHMCPLCRYEMPAILMQRVSR